MRRFLKLEDRNFDRDVRPAVDQEPMRVSAHRAKSGLRFNNGFLRLQRIMTDRHLTNAQLMDANPRVRFSVTNWIRAQKDDNHRRQTEQVRPYEEHPTESHVHNGFGRRRRGDYRGDG